MAAAASVAADDCVFLLKWGARAAASAFDMPERVALAAGGTIYVVDSGNHRIQAFGGLYPDHWRGEYHANRWLAEAPSLIREGVAIDFDWGSGSPGTGIPADDFSVC